MGLRKPAVRSVLKTAKRKHQEGKIEEAKAIAIKAGQVAGKVNNGKVISETAKTSGLPREVVVVAEAAYLNEVLPVKRRRGPIDKL